MEDTIKWRKTEQFDETDFYLYMRDVPINAVYVEQEQFFRGRKFLNYVGHNNKYEEDTASEGKLRTLGKYPKAKSDRKVGLRRPREVPPCPNPKCFERHFISDCSITLEKK